VDAVVIATPIATHFELAREALLRGKHVIGRKTHLPTVSRLAKELVELAEREGCTLMTGHTFIYSPPVIAVKEPHPGWDIRRHPLHQLISSEFGPLSERR